MGAAAADGEGGPAPAHAAPAAGDPISRCMEDVLSGVGIGMEDARLLMDVPDARLPDLAAAADSITRGFNGPAVDVEQLANIRRNSCTEDCSFCAQSAFYPPGREAFELPGVDEVVERARRARDAGSDSYCLVAAWRSPPADGFERVCEMVRRIAADVGIGVECSLGFLTDGQAAALKAAGVRRYNHNLETARSKFPEICTTHTYDDRIDTLRRARSAGLELCTGGIIGMGETRRQRLELAAELAALAPEEVTVNILVPVPGTPLGLQRPLPPGEAERMFAVLRFLLPEAVIKMSGGREAMLPDAGRSLLRGGANGLITEGYLTMGGSDAASDIAMIRAEGLEAGGGGGGRGPAAEAAEEAEAEKAAEAGRPQPCEAPPAPGAA